MYSEMAADSSSAKFGLPRIAAQPTTRAAVAVIASAGPARAEANVLAEMSSTGNTTGESASQSGGSARCSAGVSRSSPAYGRMSMGIRRSSQPLTASPTSAMGIPMTPPTSSSRPKSTSNAAAMNTGPGVGGTIEWVTAAPATIAQTNCR